LAVSGESLDLTLQRECAAATGLSATDAHDRTALRAELRMHRRLPERHQVEDMLVSDCVLSEDVIPCNPDGAESEIRLATLEETWSMLEAGAFTHEAEACILDSIAIQLKRAQAS